MSELKPCPFCGGEAEIRQKGNDRTAKRSVTIRCKGCRFQRTDGAIRYGMDWLIETTTHAWNTRAAAHRPSECIHGFPITTDCALCADKGGFVFPCSGHTPAAVPVEALEALRNELRRFRVAPTGKWLDERIADLIDQYEGDCDG